MQPRMSPVLACLTLLGRAVGDYNYEDQVGVGGGGDRMSTSSMSTHATSTRSELEALRGDEYENIYGDEYEKYAHLSDDERRAVLSGNRMVEVELESNGIPIILDRPLIMKYVDFEDLDYWGAAKEGNLTRLQELLDAGQLVDATQDGATAMYWAQYYMQPEAMKMLLERGADPNKKELRGGFYPLHASAFHEEDCVGCARLLLGAGARIAVHWYSMTPYDYAMYRNRTGLAGVIEAEAHRLGMANFSTSLEPY